MSSEIERGTPVLESEIGKVWAIAWPLILTNILNVTVGIIDLKMVGVLGYQPIAAVGMARQVSNFFMVLMIAITGGASVLIAHAFGAGDKKRLQDVASRSVVYMLVTAVLVITPVGYFTSRGFLIALGASDRVIDLGNQYLKTLFLGSIFTCFNFAISAVLLGIGKTKVSLVLLLGVNLLNIPLNYLLIFGAGPIPAFGVTGAALGTVIARALGAVAGLRILGSPRFTLEIGLRDGWVFDWDLIKRIFHLGGPRSLQGVVRNFSGLMTVRIITLLPDATRAVSAYSVGMQVRMISSFIGLAFMSAAMARVGQNMGGGKPEMAAKSGWIAAFMAAGLMSVLAIVFFFAPTAIMSFFTGDQEVIAMGRSYFVIIALFEPVLAFAFALGGALRGGGDPISPFVYSSISDLVIVIAAGYLFAIPLGMGFPGIAIGIAVSSLTRAVPTTLKWRQGKWKTVKL